MHFSELCFQRFGACLACMCLGLQEVFNFPWWGCVYVKKPQCQCPSSTTNPTSTRNVSLWVVLRAEVPARLDSWSRTWVEDVGGSVIYFCMPDLNHLPLLTPNGSFQLLEKTCSSLVSESFKLQRHLPPDQKIKASSRIPNELILGNLDVPEKKASVLSMLLLSSLCTKYSLIYVSECQ
jgi:hypothetical protein